MKFKKVEIQAFRAYNLAKDGTFDFTRGEEAADFVSIFAPNGFGKTSFYDAVEWGVTHNIHRFLKRHKLNQQVAKSEKNINDAEHTHILRNKFADDQLPAFVNLYTTLSEEPIKKELKKPRKGQPDYKFDEGDTIRGYFQEVILSQEWIDSFLKEDDGASRYKTFIKYFGDKELDQYYKCLTNLIKTNEDTVKRLKDQLKGFQLDLAFDGDQKVMDAANQVITRLKESGQSLNYLDNNFNDEESVVLNSIITARIHELNQHNDRYVRLMELAELAISGNEDVDSLEVYQKHLQDFLEMEKKIKETKGLIGSFDELARTNNQIASLAERKNTLKEQQKYLEDMVGHFPRYDHIRQLIDKNIDDQRGKDEQLKGFVDAKGRVQASITKLKAELESNSRNIATLNANREKIPSIITEIGKRNTRGLELNAALAADDIELNRLVRTNAALRSDLEALAVLRNQIERNEPISGLPKSLERFEPEVKELDEIRKIGLGLSNDLQKRSLEVKKQKVLIDDLGELLRRGLSLVNESKSSTCPLCNQDYQDYLELAKRIADNDSLDKSLKMVLREQSDSELKRAENEELLDVQKESLSSLLGLEEQRLLDSQSSSLAKEADLRGKMEANRAELLTIGERIIDLNSQLSNLPVEEYAADLKAQLIKLETSGDQLRSALSRDQQELVTAQQKIDSANAELKKLQDENDGMRIDLSYVAILDFFRRHVDDTESSMGIGELDKRLASLVEILDQTIKNEQSLQKLSDELREKTSSFQLDPLKVTLSEQENTSNRLGQRISLYEEFVRNELQISVKGQSMDQTVEFITKFRGDQRKSVDDNKTVIGLFDLLSKLKEGIIPYLRFQKAKQDEMAIRARIKLLNSTLKSTLEKERDLVIAHIEAQINSFFFEDIINTLYRKIDPHPDYKEIKFKCDFTDNNPQLNVCVTDEMKVTLQIPNLYFSTAQLNILSLSIFLAKALHATDQDDKPLECIFIDDPIQAMDSINILSTIDLLRSITVNLGRQIILSTHDANFHNLLMKKIPQKLYNSKFMELETFGKVKPLEAS